MNELNDLDFENSETCPNCGQFVGEESSCPHCGAILHNEDEMGEFEEEGEDF